MKGEEGEGETVKVQSQLPLLEQSMKIKTFASTLPNTITLFPTHFQCPVQDSNDASNRIRGTETHVTPAQVNLLLSLLFVLHFHPLFFYFNTHPLVMLVVK